MSILKVYDENGLVRYDFIDSMPHSTPDGGGFVLYGSNVWVSKPWRYCYDGMLVIHLQKRIKYGLINKIGMNPCVIPTLEIGRAHV